jgi:hypothetical protein
MVNREGCERSSLNLIHFRITGSQTEFELRFSQIQTITAANLTANFDFLPQFIQSLTANSPELHLKKFNAHFLPRPVQHVRFNAFVSMTAIAGSTGGSRLLYTAAVLRNTLKSTTLSEKLLTTPVLKKKRLSLEPEASLLCSKMSKQHKFSFRHQTQSSKSILILAYIPNCTELY